MRDKRRQEDRPTVFSDAAIDFERALVGSILAEPDRIYEINNDIRPEFFQEPRNGHIWNSMLKSVVAGDRPTEHKIRFNMPADDRNQEIPIKAYFSILIRDAEEMLREHTFRQIVDVVVNLSSRRDLLQRLSKTMRDLETADIGTSVAKLADEAMRSVSLSSSVSEDEDMMTYDKWADGVMQQISDALDHGNTNIGLSPGLRGVQQVIGRLLPGKVYVVAGLSGGGKSAITRQMAEAAAIDGHARGMGHGYMLSMEMTGKEQVSRSLAYALGIPSNRIESADMNRAEFERIVDQGMRMMRRIPLVVDQRAGLSMEGIRARMIKARVRHGGLSFGVIDHLLLIKGSGRDGLAERVLQSMTDVKTLAKELGIPIIILSQVKEEAVINSTRMEPTTNHLYGGGAIKQNADGVMFINRPIEVLRMKGPDGRSKDSEAVHEALMQSKIHVGHVYNEKGRGIASGTRRELFFHGESASFSDIEEQQQ